MLAARGQRIQAAPGAPGEEAAQAGFGVLTGRAPEPGQVGSHGQPQPIGEHCWMTGRDGREVCEVHHHLTLRSLQATTKPANAPGAACADTAGGRGGVQGHAGVL
jgi:hypothetical protein